MRCGFAGFITYLTNIKYQLRQVLVMSLIPELENRVTKKRRWSTDEIDTLRRYYGKIAEKELQPHLDNRTLGAIRVKALELGLSDKKV